MSLPACHSRRFFDGETERFFCAHPNMHVRDQIVTAEICRICSYWQQDPPEEFRPFTPGPLPKPRGLCLHLGDMMELRDCPTCSGTVKVKVFACGHPNHQETTLRACLDCPDHQPRPTVEAAAGQRVSLA